MPKNFLKQNQPFRIPTTDGKLIEEHFGVASTQHQDFSIAHMVAPPGWGEPYQTPEFDEVTIMISGKKRVQIEGETVDLKPGESILVRKGSRVRYSNPFDEKAEYWAVCIPAFTLETVHREDK